MIFKQLQVYAATLKMTKKIFEIENWLLRRYELESKVFFFDDDFFGKSFRNNLIKVKDIKEWEKFSNQSWLYSIILNLVRDYFELQNHQRSSVVLDTIKNCADFWIPMSALGHVQVSPFFVGLMGVTSSLLAILPLVDPNYKF